MTTIESRSPQAPSDLVVRVPDTAPDEVATAAGLARDAAAAWGRGPAQARAAALHACAEAVVSATGELTDLVVREVGKPVGEAGAEIGRGVAILRYFAQQALHPEGEVYPPADGVSLLHTRRRPHGVVGLITPWNFPVAIPLWKAAPALAFGNTVLLKPAPQSSAVALRLAELFADALPRGVLTILTGLAGTGEALVDAADAISFTGSVRAGQAVAVRAATRGIPVQCEMGGQNAAIVLPDADQDAAATAIAAAAMGYAGQKCTATSRVIVVGDAAPFAERLAAAVAALPVGDPADPATVVGPLIESRPVEAIRAAVRRAEAGGAQVLTGTRQPGGDGWFQAPTVLADVPPGDDLLSEEYFGPVCAVLPAESADAAVRTANNVRHGLVAAVYTQNLAAALTLTDQLDVGMVKVNAPTTGVDFHAPFGGEKESSYGPREQGTAARDFYTRTVTITLTP
ncbi:aldehyde dehydrogenase family protein [Actinoplanes friuliensis]|uniref:Aldehyde dehydrogenase n=1 Tax=Actinoplanes friuliensis DSM 7358 TaxID=1246995 RepID=U5VYR1_9ACTN|nr:aldehyde dehydrogenase family protein [Actinoplanes friuliensis]AGZ40801.1 aldehyde dehydrogenase [Actinoplanes friuliensis DSM 7358]